uniref:Uncharacterized protein n=1 Tax=Oryza barthii TaxID=65489 RepID=A0A0D3EQ22_9ORYZ
MAATNLVDDRQRQQRISWTTDDDVVASKLADDCRRRRTSQKRSRLTREIRTADTCAASPIPLPHALTPETAPPSALPSPTASPICPARRQGCRLAAVYIAAHSVVIESVLGQESRRRRCPPRRSIPHSHRSPLLARPPPTPRRKPFCRQVSADAFHAELLLAATDPCCQVAADAFRTELLLAMPPRRRR